MTEVTMRTTVTIDDDLIDQAMKLSGTRETSALVKQGLRALVEQESARRLARLGGSVPTATAAPRDRGTTAAA
jgi:Arc/MetJ family transcription regulator